MSQSDSILNFLLRALPPAAATRLLAVANRVHLPLRLSVLLPDQIIEYVYFVESGTVSMIAALEDGELIEVGLAGREGFVGLPIVLGTTTSPLEALVQIEGDAYRIAASEFRTLLSELPSLMPIMLRYVDAFYTQVTVTAACNRHHEIEQRLARWILMTHDRVESDRFVMTHEFLSTMLGVQRPGVTLALGALKRAGLVQHERRVMTVLDRAGLEAASCECYGLVRRRDRLVTDES